MPSPVPRHLRTDAEHLLVPAPLRDHVVDLDVQPRPVTWPRGGPRHSAKFAPGLSTVLLKLADTPDLGDPMAGAGTLAWETWLPIAVNDLDKRMSHYLDPLIDHGSEVSYVSADEVAWRVEAVVFSPPYYPRTDRRRPNAHDDDKRGPVVGFRDSYGCDDPKFIGDPGGVEAILRYRESMTKVYAHMLTVADRMVVVTKNWMRLGTELRLDLDTILMAMETGWTPTARHGWIPNPSLWARYNHQRGGMVLVEDVLMFEKEQTWASSFRCPTHGICTDAMVTTKKVCSLCDAALIRGR